MKSLVFSSDIELKKEMIEKSQGYKAIEDTIRASVLMQKGEDDMDSSLGVPWVEFLNNEIQDYEIRFEITHAIERLGLVHHVIIEDFDKLGNSLKIRVRIQYEGVPSIIEISYEGDKNGV